MYSKPIEAQYNGFRISGAAQPVAMSNKRWFAVGEVSLNKRDHSVLLVDRFLDDNLIYDDEVLSRWFDLGIAEITVDHCLPPGEYFFLSMNVDWAGDILRRAALECKERESGGQNYMKLWILRVTTRGIQHDCIKYLVDRLNDLGKNYRSNLDEIKMLRRQLEIIRRPVV